MVKQYKVYDAYLLEAERNKWLGVRTFFNMLQQLLYFKYFAPANERLTRDCFQTAMGDTASPMGDPQRELSTERFKVGNSSCTDGLNVVNSMLGRPPCDLPAFDSVDTFRTELRYRGSKLNTCIRHLAETKSEGQHHNNVERLGSYFWKSSDLGFRKKSKKRSKRKRRRTRRFI